MTQDSWQLRQWCRVECIKNPKPGSRSILISGEIKRAQYVNYYVVFENKRQLTEFVLRYSDLFEPIIYQDKPTINEEIIIWDYFAKISVKRNYSDGP